MFHRALNALLRPLGLELGERDANRAGIGAWHDAETGAWCFALGRLGFSLVQTREARVAAQMRELAAWEAEEARATARRVSRRGARRAA